MSLRRTSAKFIPANAGRMWFLSRARIDPFRAEPAFHDVALKPIARRWSQSYSALAAGVGAAPRMACSVAIAFWRASAIFIGGEPISSKAACR